MIAFDLVCTKGAHQFEGWFASSSDYEQQKAGGLLTCPVCGDGEIRKAVMAPNVGKKGNQMQQVAPSRGRADPAIPLANMSEMPVELVEAIGKIAEMQAKILERSDWVGDRFAEEARAIHYGEADDRIIHGNATIDDARELHEEGIAVAPLPLPFIPPDAKN
jgi:hypothetical protein